MQHPQPTQHPPQPVQPRAAMRPGQVLAAYREPPRLFQAEREGVRFHDHEEFNTAGSSKVFVIMDGAPSGAGLSIGFARLTPPWRKIQAGVAGTPEVQGTVW